MANNPTTDSLPTATQQPDGSNGLSLLLPIYSIEDAKAALQQRVALPKLMRRLGCTSITFEIPSGKLADIQEQLGPYSNQIKLYYVRRNEQEGYILHRLPHYQPPAAAPAPARERIKYVTSAKQSPQQPEVVAANPEDDRAAVVTPIAAPKAKRT